MRYFWPINQVGEHDEVSPNSVLGVSWRDQTLSCLVRDAPECPCKGVNCNYFAVSINPGIRDENDIRILKWRQVSNGGSKRRRWKRRGRRRKRRWQKSAPPDVGVVHLLDIARGNNVHAMRYAEQRHAQASDCLLTLRKMTTASLVATNSTSSVSLLSWKSSKSLSSTSLPPPMGGGNTANGVRYALVTGVSSGIGCTLR